LIEILNYPKFHEIYGTYSKSEEEKFREKLLTKMRLPKKNSFNKKIFPEKHRIPLKVNSVFFYYSILYILENYSKY
jgi:hypothetical protein